MSDEKSGVCAIVPRHQEDFRPLVFGMGILVNSREIVTCAHVVDTALGSAWLESSEPAIVSVCFPFSESHACIDGTVDRKRWYAAVRTRGAEPSDVAVIQLARGAPIERAVLHQHVVGVNAKVYGFRGKIVEGVWKSHPYGEWVDGKIVGPQPGGRAQFDGLRSTGAHVERGFSGGAVYDYDHKRVVGMIVESDRDQALQIAQFIDVFSLKRAIGKVLSLKLFIRDLIAQIGRFLFPLSASVIVIVIGLVALIARSHNCVDVPINDHFKTKQQCSFTTWGAKSYVFEALKELDRQLKFIQEEKSVLMQDVTQYKNTLRESDWVSVKEMAETILRNVELATQSIINLGVIQNAPDNGLQNIIGKITKDISNQKSIMKQIRNESKPNIPDVDEMFGNMTKYLASLKGHLNDLDHRIEEMPWYAYLFAI